MEVSIFKRGGKIKKRTRTFDRAVLSSKAGMPKQTGKTTKDYGLSSKGSYIKETRSGKFPTLKQKISVKPVITISVGANPKTKKFAGVSNRRMGTNDMIMKFMMGEQKLKEQDKSFEGLKKTFQETSGKIDKKLTEFDTKQAEIMTKLEEARNPPLRRTGAGYLTEEQIEGGEAPYRPPSLEVSDVAGLTQRLEEIEKAKSIWTVRKEKVQKEVKPLIEAGQTKITDFPSIYKGKKLEAVEEEIKEEAVKIKEDPAKREKPIRVVRKISEEELKEQQREKAAEVKSVEANRLATEVMNKVKPEQKSIGSKKLSEQLQNLQGLNPASREDIGEILSLISASATKEGRIKESKWNNIKPRLKETLNKYFKITQKTAK